MQLADMSAVQRVVEKPGLIRSLEGLASGVSALVPEVEKIHISIDCRSVSAFDVTLLGAGDFPLGGCHYE